MAARERKKVAVINICASFAKPLVGVLLIYLFSVDASYILLGYIISFCAVVFVAENYFHKKISKKERPNRAAITQRKDGNSLGKELFAFTWPFYIWGIFGWMHLSCDRWALQSFHGAEVVGAFFVVSQLAVYPLVAGSSFLSTFFIPIAYQRAGGLKSKDNFKSANKILLVMSGLYLVGAVSLISAYSFFHEWLVLMVSSEQYTAYSGLLPGLTGAWALFYLGQMFSCFGMLANKSILNIMPILFCGITATGLTFYFSSFLGVIGVVWGLGISGLIYAIWFFIIAIFLLREKKS